ncbi:MAG: 2-dehydropantoate 2-reductase [Lachnospiraceae bacterium]|nr:2-dehydropantoate 2-reductase [Lachnospiraceae bacterium]
MPKYLIVGTGGTGGPLGSYLAKAGKDVTFVARGNNLQAMKEHGLKVIRPNDEFVIDPIKVTTLEDYSKKADVIFVCVKGYSLDAIIPELKRISDKDTIIIPILNIFGTGGKMQEYFDETLVTDGCIYVAAQIKEPGCIQMNGDILRVIFGVRNETKAADNKAVRAEQVTKLRDIEKDLNESGIMGVLSDNIERDALLKFSYVSAQGACGLYYNVSAGAIQKPGEIRDCFAGLISEIDELAHAMGITFEEDIVKRNLAILDDLSESATTSLQRDIAAGRDSEIDGLIYEVVRLSGKYDTKAPLYRKVAEALKNR